MSDYMKKLIPILLMVLTVASCKKHKLKKEIEHVAGTYSGLMEEHGERTHIDSTRTVTDTVYSTAYGLSLRIEPFGFNDNEIVARSGNLIDFKVIYLGDNIKTQYTYQAHYAYNTSTLVYYPSTDSLFITIESSSNTGFPPYHNNYGHYYFRGKGVVN